MYVKYCLTWVLICSALMIWYDDAVVSYFGSVCWCQGDFALILWWRSQLHSRIIKVQPANPKPSVAFMCYTAPSSPHVDSIVSDLFTLYLYLTIALWFALWHQVIPASVHAKVHEEQQTPICLLRPIARLWLMVMLLSVSEGGDGHCRGCVGPWLYRGKISSQKLRCSVM